MKNEQRTTQREALPGTPIAIVDVESGVEFEAAARDVSSDGLCFLSTLEPPVGADMHVTLAGARPMRASLHVLRVTKAARGYEVAGRLSRLG